MKIRITIGAIALLFGGTLGVAPETSAATSGKRGNGPFNAAAPDSDGRTGPVASEGLTQAATAQDRNQPTYVGRFVIRSSYNGRCLDADLNTIARNGTRVRLWDCLPGNRNQWWDAYDYGTYTRFRNVYSNRFLDADMKTIARNGTRVQLWDFVRGKKNQWCPVIRYSTYWRIANSHSERYLDADMKTIGGNATKVQLWNFISQNKNQWWSFEPV
jgi:Ricin-type beta-trefoil lectin domain-like